MDQSTQGITPLRQHLYLTDSYALHLAEELGVEPQERMRPLTGFEVQAPHRGRDSSGCDTSVVLRCRQVNQLLQKAVLVIKAAQVEQ